MQLDNSVKKEIRKYAIRNAAEYGKASEGSVLSKIISLHPQLKADIKSLALEVKGEVAEVNKLSKDQVAREFAEHEEEFKASDAQRAEKSSKHNFSVAGAEKGNFVTRFPPEPGGYMHIGHAKPAFIEDELRKVYGGKLMLYFDDTNAENEKQEFVDAFKDDLKWLGINFDAEYYASDNLPVLYGYAKDVIRKGKAYVCMCDADTVKEGRSLGTECLHKSQSIDKNVELWQKMLNNGFKDNEAILRLNSNMNAVNTTLRDPTLFRLKHAKHYRQGDKYFVWPTYDFCTPIVDSLKGITDVVRSKEYEMRDELYFMVLEILGLRKPRINSISRLEIADNLTSKRKIRELIAQKLIDGYDDPRLVTIRALRRRGLSAEAIREFSLSFGMGKAESVVDIDMLLGINRKLISTSAKKLSFTKYGGEGAVKCELWNIGKLLIGDEFNSDSVKKEEGFAEGANPLKTGEIVQFDNIGFYRLDSKKDMRFLSL